MLFTPSFKKPSLTSLRLAKVPYSPLSLTLYQEACSGSSSFISLADRLPPWAGSSGRVVLCLIHLCCLGGSRRLSRQQALRNVCHLKEECLIQVLEPLELPQPLWADAQATANPHRARLGVRVLGLGAQTPGLG